MTDRARQLRWIASFAVCAFIADQASKALVRARIAPATGGVDGVFFQFVHHANTGIVGGMFHEIPLVAYLAPLAAMGVLIYLYFNLDLHAKWQSTAFGLVCGGALGNMIDRILHGGVTDFLQFHFIFIPFDFPWKYYPAFNIADSCIVVGVVLLIATWARPAPKENAKENNAPRPV